MIRCRLMLGVSVLAATVAIALTAAGWSRVSPTETLPVLAASERAFPATMEAHTSAPIVGGNRIDVLLNGDQIFPVKLAAIRSARSTITYAEGPAVLSVQSAFLESWREATGELLGGDRYFGSPRRAAGDGRAQVVKSSPASGSYEMYTMYLLAIVAARESIRITNPYFLPDGRLEEALIDAAARGVRIVALTPGKIDHNVVRAASRRGFGRLMRAGIEIHEYQAALLHAKTMLVDGVWATVGSTNFDNRSFALNEELNVVIYEPGAIARLAAAFDADLRHARRITYEAWENRGLRAKLFELFVLPVRSQL